MDALEAIEAFEKMEAYRQTYEQQKVTILKNIDSMNNKLRELELIKSNYELSGDDKQDTYIKNKIDIQIDIINSKLIVTGYQLETINAKLMLFS
jgi:hypothetical protein